MVPPGQDCALNPLRGKKKNKDSRQKHILTHTADIHLAVDTAGTNLSS